MTQLVYSRTLVPQAEGRTYQNPRFFSGPVKGVRSVFVDPAYPEIIAAYEGVGAKVHLLDGSPDFNGAEPAAFDHDENGQAGGSKPKAERKPRETPIEE